MRLVPENPCLDFRRTNATRQSFCVFGVKHYLVRVSLIADAVVGERVRPRDLFDLKAEPAGYINPALYQNQSNVNDITEGNNGDFKAVEGWDACTGMGSPNGTGIAAVLSGNTASKRG